MNDDDLKPFIIIIWGGIAIGLLFLGGAIAKVIERSATEQKTVVYCVEQPADCKIKYDFYKLENKK